MLRHGREKLRQCAAIQLEVSFIPVYKNQPPFGALDLELRSQGFIPHRFAAIKRWPVAPAIMGGDPRTARHQLLEADMVYVRDLIHGAPEDAQLRKLAAIAHFVYGSSDLAARCLVELEKRGMAGASTVLSYLSSQGLKR